MCSRPHTINPQAPCFFKRARSVLHNSLAATRILAQEPNKEQSFNAIDLCRHDVNVNGNCGGQES